MAEGVRVQPLMGVGIRYDLATQTGMRVSVVVHKDGHRELYVFAAGADDPSVVVPLAEEQARLLGAVLTGTYITA